MKREANAVEKDSASRMRNFRKARDFVRTKYKPFAIAGAILLAGGLVWIGDYVGRSLSGPEQALRKYDHNRDGRKDIEIYGPNRELLTILLSDEKEDRYYPASKELVEKIKERRK